jgi:hypothetical protein
MGFEPVAHCGTGVRSPGEGRGLAVEISGVGAAALMERLSVLISLRKGNLRASPGIA